MTRRHISKLAKDEGVDEHGRRPPELAGVRKRGRKHGVDENEVGRLGGDDALHLLLDRRRGEIAGGAGERQPLRIAIDLRVSLRDLDGAEASGFYARHHFGPAGERDVVPALGQDAGDAEARRQVSAARPVQPQNPCHLLPPSRERP